MICEKCCYCYEIDHSNESNGEDIIQYCKHGLGNAYDDGYCDYPFVFIPIVILYFKICRFFYDKKHKKHFEYYKLFESIINEEKQEVKND